MLPVASRGCECVGSQFLKEHQPKTGFLNILWIHIISAEGMPLSSARGVAIPQPLYSRPKTK
jgi:hypothetical protein